MMLQQTSEQSIFLHAIGLSTPTERADYLEQVYCDHPEMQAELQRLLAAHERLGEGLPPAGANAGGAAPLIAECAGTRLAGRYKLLEGIGEGGMGSVWMAQQTEPVKRLVAVKLIKAGMDSRQVLARFEAERQALALMDHPNIAKVLDGGTTENGRPYFVMDLVKGVPITTYCDEHHLTPRQRLELFLPVCAAVQHAHQKGIIHRDLKPSNVLVALYDGRPVPKVIDFGISKAVGQSLTDKTLITGFGAIVGTPEYMSPEQAEINQLDIDTRSDIYSLGVLVYELLTGSPPFTRKELERAGMLELLRVIREQEPVRPSTKLSRLSSHHAPRDVPQLSSHHAPHDVPVSPDEPGLVSQRETATLAAIAANRSTEPGKLTKLMRGDLDWIVMKALEKDRYRRYETANGFAMDVQRYLADEPVVACPPSVGYRLRKFVHRNRGPVLATALVAMALVVGIIGTTWGMLRATVAEASARSEAKQKEAALQDKEEAFVAVSKNEREARSQLFLALLSQAQALRKGGQMGQRFHSLEVLEQAVATARTVGVLDEHLLTLRNEAVACLTLADLRVTEEWQGPADWDLTWPSPVAFDAGLGRYTDPDRQGSISIREIVGHREVVRLPGPGAKVLGINQRFSPDGRFLATAYWFRDRPAKFILWELPAEQGVVGGSSPVPSQRIGPIDGVGFFTFTGDGRQLAFGHPDASIHVQDLHTGEHKRLGSHHGTMAMAFRPDGQQLAMTSGGDLTRVRILNLKTNQVVKTLEHPDDVRVLAWSQDGRLLAVGCDDRNVHVWDAEEWKGQAVLEGHQRYVWAVDFSPDGDLLASSSLDGTTRLWDSVSGRPLVTAPGRCLQFSPDGQQLPFVREDRVGIWEVADGGECHVLHHGRIGNRAPWLSYKGPDCLDFSPDERLLASASGDGVRLWDVPGRREVAFLNAGYHEAMMFHPDGTRLYTFGRTGLRCWPVRPDDRGPNSLRVGPPEMLGSPGEWDWFRGARSAKGDTIAAGNHPNDHRDRLLLFSPERPTERRVLCENTKFTRIAVSPDGRWVAAGLLEPQRGLQVWDARTGRLEWSLTCEQVYVLFSPDSEWLLAGGIRDYRAWKTGSWEPGPVFPRDRREHYSGQASFRSDGRVLAAPRSLHNVQLLDFAARREIATLPGPDKACIDDWLCFSPGGGLLAAVAESHSVHLWDLDAIGDHLKKLGLGCDLLPDRAGRAQSALNSRSTRPLGGAPLQVRVFHDVYEVEHLTILEKVDCWSIVQDMKPWGREHWSNGKSLLCLSGKGGFVELQLGVPATGRYTLEVRLTRSSDFGLVEAALDGQKLGPAFDGYLESTTPPVPVRFHNLELREGSHRLRFTAVGKNPKSTEYRFGLDCVKLTPEGVPATR